MIDFSHANSQKDPERQHLVCEDVCHQLRQGSREVCGVMIESHLVAGRQDAARPTAHLRASITDACVGWDGTETMLQQLADAVEPAARAAPPRSLPFVLGVSVDVERKRHSPLDCEGMRGRR